MVGVLHVYLFPSQAEAIECAQITEKPWKSQLRKKIRPSKRILASTIDRTHQRDFSLCNSRRIVPIQSHALWYEKFTFYFPALYQQRHHRGLSGGLWNLYRWCDYLQWHLGKKTLRTTCEFFKRLSEAKLTINLSKSEFGRAQVTSLEHVVGQSQVKPVSVKVEAITTFPQAESKKEVMRLVDMTGHCRRLCSNFATVTEPLTQLFSKKERNLFERCLRNWKPCYRMSLYWKRLILAACLTWLLMQLMLLLVLCCYKRMTKVCNIQFVIFSSSTKVKRTTPPLKKNVRYVVVYSDHYPLVFIHKLKAKTQRLLMWSLI